MEAYIWIRLASDGNPRYEFDVQWVADDLNPDQLKNANTKFVERQAEIRLRQDEARNKH